MPGTQACLSVVLLLTPGALPGPQMPPPGQAAPAPVSASRPLPDIPTLMHAVESHQKDNEAKEQDYTFRQMQTLDEVDSKDHLKKRETREYDVFWLRGVPVRKLLSKNGKPLSADELKKEDERIDKEAAKAHDRRQHADTKGQDTDPEGNEVVGVSRLLQLGTFSNARRVQIDGRDTIAVDYVGDPKAKTRNRAEEVIHDLSGTAWVDEQDQQLARAQGHFFRSFKVGAGLIGNIREGTSFEFQQRKINNAVWLPTHIEGRGSARFLLLFNFNGSLTIDDSDFRRFRSTSTLLPGVGVVDHP